jgi:hypothetical protein
MAAGQMAPAMDSADAGYSMEPAKAPSPLCCVQWQSAIDISAFAGRRAKQTAGRRRHK